MSRRVPNAWDDDDWTPSATTSVSALPPTTSSPTPFNSRILPNPSNNTQQRTLYNPAAADFSTAQQRTTYKPDLRILQRTSTDHSERQEAVLNKPRSTAAERDRERREKERKYKETRDKIFAAKTTTTTTTAPKPPPAPVAQRTPTPPKKVKKQEEEKTKKVELVLGGSITGFSLNNAKVMATPVKKRGEEEWKLRQVAIDGKMLESQAAAYGYLPQGAEVQEGGLEWDEFRRDRWQGGAGAVEYESELDERMGGVKLDEVFKEEPKKDNRGRVKKGTSDNGKSESRGASPGLTVVKPVREPKGPDGKGKGFKGRGGDGGRGGHST